VICLAPRAREKIVRPRRLSGVVMRPLNFTVRARIPRVILRLMQSRKFRSKTLRLAVSRARAKERQTPMAAAWISGFNLRVAFRARTVAAMGRALTIVGALARSASERPTACRRRG
jgi:hypothetical protein